MAIPVNKAELLNDIKTSYQKLALELATIKEPLSRKKELTGHAKDTIISVNDIIAYLISWGELVLKWNTGKERGQHIDFPETGYKWNELGLLAKKFYKDFKEDDYKTLCEKLDAVVLKVLSLIESKNNTELYKNAFYKEYTLGRLIQLNTASPYKNTLLRIRKWKKGKSVK